MSRKLDRYFDDPAPSARDLILSGVKRALLGGAARIATNVQQKPVASLFFITGACMASWIIINATLHQKQQHPSPLFIVKTTQSRSEMQSIPSQTPVALPRPIPKARKLDEKLPPAAQRVNAAYSGLELPIDYKSDQGKALVKDIQGELAAIGYYRGKIDGVWGKQAESALRAYEILSGLPEAGVPTPAILATLQGKEPDLTTASISEGTVSEEVSSSSVENTATMSSNAPHSAAKPMTFTLPQQQVSSQKEPAPVDMPTAEVFTPSRVKEAPRSTVQGENAIPELTNPWGASLTQAVEQRLSSLGYAPGKVDGKFTTMTQRAIEKFERDHDMPVSGRINGRLLQEMTAATGVPLI